MEAVKEEKKMVWDIEKQAWHCEKCNAFIGSRDLEQHCPACRQETPDHFTWDDVYNYGKTSGFEDDEYLSFRSYGDDEYDTSLQVWKPETQRIIVFWVPGGSEGYYVHIAEIQDGSRFRERGLGKYWTAERAAEVTDALTRFVYGQDHPQLNKAGNNE